MKNWFSLVKKGQLLADQVGKAASASAAAVQRAAAAAAGATGGEEEAEVRSQCRSSCAERSLFAPVQAMLAGSIASRSRCTCRVAPPPKLWSLPSRPCTAHPNPSPPPSPTLPTCLQEEEGDEEEEGWQEEEDGDSDEDEETRRMAAELATRLAASQRLDGRERRKASIKSQVQTMQLADSKTA